MVTLMAEQVGGVVQENAKRRLRKRGAKSDPPPSDAGGSAAAGRLQQGNFRGIAIEVDGPTHFLNSHPDELDGPTQLRNRLLESRGWRVVSVPVTEWQRAGPEEASKIAFLQTLLEQAGVAGWLDTKRRGLGRRGLVRKKKLATLEVS